MAVTLKLIEEAETHVMLALKGSLDMDGAWEIERDLMGHLSEAMRHLLIDMSAVDLLGSMGIRVFVRSASALARNQKKLVLFATRPFVDRALAVTGFKSAVPVVRTMKDAKAAIGV